MIARAAALVAVIALSTHGPVRAQAFEDGSALAGGVEVRSLSFARLAAARRLRQISTPLGATLSFGRVTLDVGTAWVSTRLDRADGTHHTVSDLTDTQVRAALVFGRDAVVATLAANLPTGPAAASARDYSVIGSVSPAFLGFPVPVYASGFSMTGGLAAAMEAGAWSIGLAGSLRLSGRFTPYEDLNGPISYKPGLEGRARIGADRIIGSSRLSLGFTLSTFGTDAFGSGGATTGQYRPGTRMTAEAALQAPLGSTVVNLGVWNFYRSSGDTSSVSVGNQENLLGGIAALSIPAGPRLVLEPLIEGRLWNPSSGSGRWLGAGLGLTLRLGDAVTLRPTGRYDRGSVEDPSGSSSGLSGWQASVLLQVAF